MGASRILVRITRILIIGIVWYYLLSTRKHNNYLIRHPTTTDNKLILAKLGKDREAILFPRVLAEEARRLALHRCTCGRTLLLRAGAFILEALPEHDLVRGLELQAARAAASLQKYHAIRISDAVIFLVGVHGQLAGGAWSAAIVEKAALGTAAEAGLLVEVAKNAGAAETPLNAAVAPAVGAGAALKETIIPRHC